ncbi:hypothetical protein [Marinovum sp.]|uniref:hypothetical protein n=1 Tax=Marinovum sp. TaxID=2024839 RepID=UPI003A935DDF
MTRLSFPAVIAAACLVASAASAEQYVARIDAPFPGANARLLESLKIVELDIFEHAGAAYVVIEAPDEGYVEAYFFALHLTPEELLMLQADWNAPGLSGLPLEQRLPFLTPTGCGYCTS